MDTRLLEYFVAVAVEESVTDAAHQLRAAQSTVSVGLKSLERELGVTLFERSTRAVRISEAGERLLPEAQSVLDGVERLHALAGQSARGVRGRLRIGTFAGMEELHRVPEAFGEFRKEYPGVDVSLCSSRSGSAGLGEDLQHGRLDLAFLAVPAGPELHTVELSSAPYIALLPPDHRLRERESIALSELADDDWVEVSQGFGNRLQVETALRERGLSRRIIAEVPGVPAVPRFVSAGIGVAVIPDMVDAEGCVVVNLVDALPRWRLTIAMRPGLAERPHVAAFVNILRARIRGER